MELLDHLSLGFSTALSFQNILFCFIGVLFGTVIGVLPGIGPAATIAMLLPMTFTLSPETALIMLAGIYYGAQYGGSTTAILVNMPGEPSAAVTAIDGFQMARKGRAGPALAIAAIASFVAGTIATLVIAAFAPIMAKLALSFGSPEYFSLMVLGLISSIALAHGSFLKALAMILLGVLLGLIGTDLYTGTTRFTMGNLEFADGLSFVALAVGIFGIPEILRNLENEVDRGVVIEKIKSLMPSGHEIRRSVGPILRATGVGSVLGILPGGGALLSSFASYSIEKKISKQPEIFGKGAIEGVAGPEAANNAGCQSSFIPMLTLGIPSNPIGALMIGALLIQGIVPGPGIMNDQAPLFWGLIASMWIGNLMLVILNLPLVGLWVRLLTIPYYVLFPAILAFASIGVYSESLSPYHLYTMTAFGLLGYILTKLDAEPAPFVLGFVLGPMVEDHFRRSMLLSRGDPTIFVTHPLSATLLACAAILLVIVTFPAVSRKREEIFVEED